MKTLNVGCGNLPDGDVNLDLNVEDVGHRSAFRKFSAPPLAVKEIRNFIRADALHLPFKDGAFKEALGNHVIEHVSSPELMLAEMLRVSRHRIIVKCPHMLGEKKGNQFHFHHFNAKWFHSWAKSRGLLCQVEVTRYKHFPHRYLHIVSLPKELTVIVLQKKHPKL